MIDEFIYKICGLLINKPVSVQWFAKQLGVKHITDYMLPWHPLKITQNGVQDITVVNFPNTDLVSYIRIDLDDNANFDVKGIIEKLGMYHKLPTSKWGGPSELTFEVNGKIFEFNGRIIFESNDYQDVQSEFMVQAILIIP